jgi:hypothetical protein
MIGRNEEEFMIVEKDKDTGKWVVTHRDAECDNYIDYTVLTRAVINEMCYGDGDEKELARVMLEAREAYDDDCGGYEHPDLCLGQEEPVAPTGRGSHGPPRAWHFRVGDSGLVLVRVLPGGDEFEEAHEPSDTQGGSGSVNSGQRTRTTADSRD